MNAKTLQALWDMQRMRHGIGTRCVELIPADNIDAHPIPGMRSPKELIVHMYTFHRMGAEGIESGTMPGLDEKAACAAITTREQLLAYVNECWERSHASMSKVTDVQLAAQVGTPWGESYPAAAVVAMISDEYLHHRGQLYAYLRAFGIEPPMNWDFENNAAAFRPKEHATS